MYLKDIDKLLFVNLYEFVLTPGTFELILLHDDDESNEDETVLILK